MLNAVPRAARAQASGWAAGRPRPLHPRRRPRSGCRCGSGGESWSASRSASASRSGCGCTSGVLHDCLRGVACRRRIAHGVSAIAGVPRVASGAAAGWKAKGRARGGNKWYSGMWGGCGLETSRARAVSGRVCLISSRLCTLDSGSLSRAFSTLSLISLIVIVNVSRDV